VNFFLRSFAGKHSSGNSLWRSTLKTVQKNAGKKDKNPVSACFRLLVFALNKHLLAFVVDVSSRLNHCFCIYGLFIIPYCYSEGISQMHACRLYERSIYFFIHLYGYLFRGGKTLPPEASGQ
jgi:hypothetical protein